MIEELYNAAMALKSKFMEVLPQVILSIIVLVIGYLIARLLKYIIIKLVRYFSQVLNQRFEHVNIEKTAPFIGVGFFWLVMLATFILISDLLNLTVFTKGLETILFYSPNVIAAALIVFISIFLGKFISKTISTVGEKIGFQYGQSLGNIIQYLIIFSAIIIAIEQLGIEVTFLIHIINITLASVFFAAAFAFGLGAKTSVSNILASFYIRKTYKVGDYIRIGEVEGVIAKIDATAVKITTEVGEYLVPAKTFSETQSVLIKKQ